MTTPEQLLADSGWRRRHSVYTLWALFVGFGFVSLFYTGVRAKKNNWTTWGVVYGVLVIGAIAIGSTVSPEDPEAPTPVVENIAMTIFFVMWVVSAIHVFRVRKEWLRWKAAAAGRPQWYEAPGSSTTEAPAADLAGLGMDDPTSEYLAPVPPPPAPAPAPRTTTAPPRRRLPPPPTSPPPGRTDRPLPPSPSVPPATQPAASHERDLVSTPIDLNTATVDELASLPGVGVATAHRIVEERNRRGGFESVDEAAVAAKVQPHVRSRLQQAAVVSERQQQRRRGTAGRIVDI